MKVAGDFIFRGCVFGGGEIEFDEISAIEGKLAFSNTDFGAGSVSFRQAKLGGGDMLFNETKFAKQSTSFYKTDFTVGKVVTFLHTAFSLVCLFLVGLGVRNRFRI